MEKSYGAEDEVAKTNGQDRTGQDRTEQNRTGRKEGGRKENIINSQKNVL